MHDCKPAAGHWPCLPDAADKAARITSVVHSFLLNSMSPQIMPGASLCGLHMQEVGIFCLDPRRVAISGKVRVFALDKTGTMTRPWLDFLGVQPLHHSPSGQRKHLVQLCHNHIT